MAPVVVTLSFISVGMLHFAFFAFILIRRTTYSMFIVVVIIVIIVIICASATNQVRFDYRGDVRQEGNTLYTHADKFPSGCRILRG
ncbi:MAG: hypothetical protein AABZ13_09225 [Planctomycetota bacterium]